MISEDKKVILMELLNASEDEFCNLLHIIEEDENIPKKSWDTVDKQSKRLFQLFRLIYDEIYYTDTI